MRFVDSDVLSERFIMEHQWCSGRLVGAHSMKLQALNNLMQIKFVWYCHLCHSHIKEVEGARMQDPRQCRLWKGDEMFVWGNCTGLCSCRLGKHQECLFHSEWVASLDTSVKSQENRASTYHAGHILSAMRKQSQICCSALIPQESWSTGMSVAMLNLKLLKENKTGKMGHIMLRF